MVKCENCGFEFPSQHASYRDRRSFETSSAPNNVIEEICPQCNKKVFVGDIYEAVLEDPRHSQRQIRRLVNKKVKDLV